MKPIGILSFACAAALTVACGGDTRTADTDPIGDNDAAVGTTGEARVGGDHRDFVTKMLQDGSAEVQLGTMASERGASAEVKQFGQMMVEDHTKAGEQLKQIAASHSIQPESTALDDDHRELMDKLSQLRGAEFDREYIDAMVEAHEDVVDELESRVDERDRAGAAARSTAGETAVVAEDADNPVEAALNAWAADTLPVVQRHLERARALDEKLEGANRNTTASR